MKKYQLIVIGGGAGGLTAAAGAASMGAKVALIEKDQALGGDCLHYGCVPSKALIDSAKRVHTAKEAAKEFGFSINGEAQLKMGKKRVKAAIADIQVHDSTERFEKLGIDVYFGKGQFVDEHRIQVEGGETIYGKRIVISTGSRPFIPPIEGINEVDYLTNETIFEIENVPKRLVVVGAGAIGLELSQAFSRFGADVTVLESSEKLMDHEDEEIVPYIGRKLEKELTLRFKTKAVKIKKRGNEKVITLDVDGREEEITADAILIAAGRRPNIDSIGLDKAGVDTKDGNVFVNDHLQTSKKHIYAIGDTIGTFPFTHAAGMEGKIVVSNAVFGLPQKVKYDAVPWVIFTDPEVYHLGLTEKEARKKHGEDIVIYKVGLNDVDRFIAEREKDGILKVITTKKGKILGAHAVGKGAGEWMQELVYIKQNGKKLQSVSSVIHPYPTRGAIVQRAADQYWRKKLFEGAVPKILKKYIQWFR
jgi:pyruvate/2-oxoglutarate dehydrogenase complex dihydrolipoamide dehydrogenase (E3) component